MHAIRLPSAGCHWLYRAHRLPNYFLNTVRQESYTANPIVNFLALEAKWQAIWQAKRVASEGKVQECEDSDTIDHPLAPLYYKQLRTPTILDGLIWCNSMKGGATAPHKTKSSIFDRILELTRSIKWEELEDHRDNSMNLEACIGKYGKEITRTYLVFRSRVSENPPCYENKIVQIQQWFESIREAILLAHDSYNVTQYATPATPEIPRALYEPNLDSWLDTITDTPRSWVHILPEYPNVFDSTMEEDDCKLWLTTQEAILAMKKTMGVNSLQTVESRLVALTKAVISYDEASRIFPDVHYHSARILLCLVAPLAPSFAEECWVMLHYGSNTRSIGGDAKGLDKVDQKLIEEELAEDEELWDLPRKGRPETLRSIFDQSFPVAEPKETIALLKSPSLLLEARVEREARTEKTRKK